MQRLFFLNRIKISPHGFTLIEIMIVVAIIGILAAIATNKFGDLLQKSRDAAVKNNVGGLRSAMSVYYADNQLYPTAAAGIDQPTLADALLPKYIKNIPDCFISPYHDAIAAVDNVPDANFAGDGGNWVYVSVPAASALGTIGTNCSHTDTKGSVWTSY